MSFWMKSGTLQVGTFKYSLDDLMFTFKVPFEDSEELTVATIVVYNLSETTRNSIQKNQPVILNAGYRGNIGVIFVGKVAEVSSKHSGTEWTTTIQATEAMEEWLSVKVNKTYAAGIDAMSILKDLLGIFGMEVARLELAVNKVYPRGKVCNGPARTLLTEIITSDCKSTMVIRHNQIIIRDPNDGTNLGVLLTPKSGLLPSSESADAVSVTTAQDTLKTADEKAEEDSTIKRECLLNHRITAGDIVRIKDKTLNGNYLVKSGQHEGNRKGKWRTELEVIPV